MGFFSWKTQNTNKSIANRFSSNPTFTVTMIDNKGNKWVEHNYEGYGRFGGKDYYELMAEMNGFGSDRNEAIYSKEKGLIQPNLYEGEGNFIWINEIPEACIYQGYFYSKNNIQKSKLNIAKYN